MRHRDDDDDDYNEDDEYKEENRGGKSGGRKRPRSDFIDDAAEEDDVQEEEDEFEEDEDEGRRGRGRGRGNGRQKAKKRLGSEFFDEEALVGNDDDVEDEEEVEDGFIVDDVADLPDEDSGRRFIRRPFVRPEDEQEDYDDLERRIQERYARSNRAEREDYEDEGGTEVDQQSLLPSVKDPKLWMVKCAIGREREAATCLMQKFIDSGSQLQIRSAVALDHLKNYIYVEAQKEAHVREACKGLRVIFAQKILLVPIEEMTDVLSVESKSVDLTRDTWVRMKLGIYKNDLAQVVNVDSVRQKVTVKLIPRVDLQEGRDVPKKKQFVPPPRYMNIDEARDLHIRVERRRDQSTGDYFESIAGMLFKDGFLYKAVSLKSLSVQNINPTFDELEKFQQPGENGIGDNTGTLSTLFANRKKTHFHKGDAVIVIKGDLKNLKGFVEKVEEDSVHIRPQQKELPKSLAVNAKDLCKYFEPGNHVKIVSGTQQGATGMVLKVDNLVLIILSDTTKEYVSDNISNIHVFADDVVKSSEVTSGVTKIGDYELRDLVLLNNSFGVITRVENEAFQVLMGLSDRPEVALVKLREIKCKIERKSDVQDRDNNRISVKDVVKILEGPCKGKQGPVEHIYKGVLFVYDRHHLEHAGFICAKANYCMVVGGSRACGDKNGDSYTRFGGFKAPSYIPQSPNRFPRGGPQFNSGGRHNRGGRVGCDALLGTTIKIMQGPYKSYRGRVIEIKNNSVRIELESQMKVVTVDRNSISDNVVITPNCDTSRYVTGSQTPMHPTRTPQHLYMTPMREVRATPIHDGMWTPMRDPAWNPYTPRGYAAYSNKAPSPYISSMPSRQPNTPNSVHGLPGTPGTGVIDAMSPPIGGENDGPWLMPDILVKVVHRSRNEAVMGVILQALSDGSCKVGLNDNHDIVTALPNDLKIVMPDLSDRVKIIGGHDRGATAKVIGLYEDQAIVKLDETFELKILSTDMLAKLA
ncbi:hypothetical protein ACFE04_025962 [Oxalis oulophora]